MFWFNEARRACRHLAEQALVVQAVPPAQFTRDA
jgi:hypothetical protein